MVVCVEFMSRTSQRLHQVGNFHGWNVNGIEILEYSTSVKLFVSFTIREIENDVTCKSGQIGYVFEEKLHSNS